MKNTAILILILAASAWAQSGGSYAITQSVIAGGGRASAGGSFAVEGTIGQSSPYISDGGVFSVRGGFWAADPLAPTAAHVAVSGRVVLNDDGMRRVRITLQNLSTGVIRSVAPNQFGNFRFDDVEIGFYLIRAESGLFTFSPDNITVNLIDDLTDVSFQGFSNR